MAHLTQSDCCCINSIIDNKLNLFRQNILNEVINLINQIQPGGEPIGLQAEVRNSSGGQLVANSLIPFDTVVSDQSGTISMSGSTFTVTVAGVYSVSYYVNTGGTETKTSVNILCNGIECEGTYANQGQMSGFALLKLNAGDVISLTNGNGEIIVLDISQIQAGVSITKV